MDHPEWGAWEWVVLLNLRCKEGVQRLLMDSESQGKEFTHRQTHIHTDTTRTGEHMLADTHTNADTKTHTAHTCTSRHKDTDRHIHRCT